jgi:hypothetical protein
MTSASEAKFEVCGLKLHFFPLTLARHRQITFEKMSIYSDFYFLNKSHDNLII